MSKLHYEVVAKNEAWWVSHPDKRQTASADSLARSVVHWHHNVESRRRHAGWSAAEGDEFFRRQYAIAATWAWLLEARSRRDKLRPSDWYQWRDVEVEIRTLQNALDDFEYNSANPMCKP